MSMTMFTPAMPFHNSEGNRRSFGRLFGRFIQGSREKTGLSTVDMAALAGMTAIKWEAVEAGQVPETREELESVARALKMGRGELGELVLLCRDAWGV